VSWFMLACSLQATISKQIHGSQASNVGTYLGTNFTRAITTTWLTRQTVLQAIRTFSDSASAGRHHQQRLLESHAVSVATSHWHPPAARFARLLRAPLNHIFLPQALSATSCERCNKVPHHVSVACIFPTELLLHIVPQAQNMTFSSQVAELSMTAAA